MKKIIFKLLLILIFLGLVAGGIYFYKEYKKEKKLTEVIATSIYGNVYRQDINEYIDKMSSLIGNQIDLSALKKEDEEIIIKEIVSQRKILQDAYSENVQNTEEYKKQMESIKEDVVKDIYIRQLIEKNVTEQAIKEKYEQLKIESEGKKEYKVKHILVQDEETIKRVVAELKTKTFADVAKQYSIDSSKENGGDLGYISEGQTVSEFNAVLAIQPINQISKPFKTQFGWHILIKEEERKVKLPSFDESKNIIKDSISKEYIKNLTTKNIEGAKLIIK